MNELCSQGHIRTAENTYSGFNGALSQTTQPVFDEGDGDDETEDDETEDGEF